MFFISSCGQRSSFILSSISHIFVFGPPRTTQPMYLECLFLFLICKPQVNSLRLAQGIISTNPRDVWGNYSCPFSMALSSGMYFNQIF